MKPVLIYVDDEAHNLTVLEAALPSDWEIHTFDSPLAALDKLPSLNPWVVLSDQRMPGMMGVNFLEIVKKVCPYAIRALVTGYSDEDLVVDSVRKAQVYDYIRKPWDVEDLEHRITKLVETYGLERELREKTAKLEHQNNELVRLNETLQKAQNEELAMRKELEAWAPPFILSTLTNKNVQFPIKKDLAVITFDLVGSSKLHGLMVQEKPARTHILHAFSELVLKQGGWRESHSGDSAYAHFGLLKEVGRPADAAFAVATEFRVFLRNFSNVNGIDVECGIGLHIAKDCLIDIHTIKVTNSEGDLIQKSFDSYSSDIDLVHRMEKFTHTLPGSNVIMSGDFITALGVPPAGITHLGQVQFRGQKQNTDLYIKLSDKVKPEDLEKLKDSTKVSAPENTENAEEKNEMGSSKTAA